MKRLLRAPNVVTGQHWINLLEAAGIGCELHNRYLQGALGEIPADQCGPELWIADERDAQLALRLLDAAIRGPAAGTPPWHCARCGESLEPQFTVCWQCGTARDPLDG
jgi:hypothetical protein